MGVINLSVLIDKIKRKLLTAGFITKDDKASKSKFGIVKIGNGLSVSGGVISVAADTDYSTTEQKIGKWVDGTTDVYEITIATTDTAYTIANSELVLGNIPGLDRLVSLQANISTSDKTKYLPLPDHQANTLTNLYIKKGDTVDVVFKSADTWSSTNITVIARYTKTA